MKICNKCGVEKEETKFRWPRNGCSACDRAADKVRRSVPGYLEAEAAKMRAKREDPKYREQEKINRAKYRLDPEVRAREIDYYKGYNAQPEVKERERKRMEDKRQGPEYRAQERLKVLEYRSANSEEINAKARQKKAKRRRLLNLLKMERPCYDCGGMFPVEATDWDHLPQFEKKFNLSNLESYSLEEGINEINKCQLVCANCHRVRTQARKQKKI